MKIFSFSLFLITANLFACPNFAGKYSCKDDSGTWEISISQTEENGVTTYQLTQEERVQTYIADGVSRPFTAMADSEPIEGTIFTNCNDSSVMVQFLGDYQGKPVNFKQTIEGINGVLQINEITKLGGEEVNNVNYTCSPNP
jgi:hypothetical protein